MISQDEAVFCFQSVVHAENILAKHSPVVKEKLPQSIVQVVEMVECIHFQLAYPNVANSASILFPAPGVLSMTVLIAAMSVPLVGENSISSVCVLKKRTA